VVWIEPAIAIGRRTGRAQPIMAQCSCAALWAGTGSAAASYACGAVKVINGYTMRVQVVRGTVSCPLARLVIRYSIPTPGDLPPGPDAWSCAGSASRTIICRKGTRTVLGRRR
jgi:hypothetical protein